VIQEHAPRYHLRPDLNTRDFSLWDSLKYRNAAGNAGQITNRMWVNYKTVLPKELTDPETVKKFPTFYGTRKFNSAFTGAHYLSLS